MKSDIGKMTCLSIDCPERTGGECNAMDRSDMKNLTAEALSFLFESNEIEDVHDAESLMQAVYAWDFLMEQEELTPAVVLKTHKILMLHQKLRPDQKGYFRKEAVFIGGREGKPWYVVPELIENWCLAVNAAIERVRGKRDVQEDEQRIKEHHISYEKVHPFIDGNGRTGRMFLNWQRVKVGLPILVIWADKRQEYYKWFK